MAEGIVDLSPNREDKPPVEAPKQPQAAPQPIPYEVHKKEGRRWPLLLVFFLLALIVATGVVLAGRWAYREVSNKDSSPSQTTPQIKKTSEPAATSKESSGQSSSGSNSSTNNPAPGPNPSGSSTQLPKTGDD